MDILAMAHFKIIVVTLWLLSHQLPCKVGTKIKGNIALDSNVKHDKSKKQQQPKLLKMVLYSSIENTEYT